MHWVAWLKQMAADENSHIDLYPQLWSCENEFDVLVHLRPQRALLVVSEVA